MGVFSDMFGDDILEHPLMYRGVVEDNDDPEKAGRIKVRILGIHSDNSAYVETKHLPWAIPATSLNMSGGGTRNIGISNVPSIGSHVFIFFESGDHNYPVYFAGAPAIEDVQDYQEKEGKLKNGVYEFDKQSQYDDKSSYSDKMKKFETPNDENIQHPVQDWNALTRKNAFGEDGEAQLPPPKKDNFDPQPIFPSDFFLESIRIAFDGAANHDAPGYDGRHTTKPSNELTKEEKKQELDEWSERKWGFNDNDDKHQHKFGGDQDWKPEYPLVSVERNPQGEIVETDILKERRCYLHPSKYFIELVQLDCSRQKDDFKNEVSIKNIYERQRGVANTPDITWSKPQNVKISGESNNSEAIDSTSSDIQKRINNEIEYDDIDGNTRSQKLGRFEERKHNPGREKTVVEDFVYRFYMNKYNETFQLDRNTRIYTGNDNLEVEHGDRNVRLHRGSYNQHIDEGNYNRVVNRGWEHLHVDEGHHFIEICGSGSGDNGSAYNSFESSGSHEPVGNPDNADNQHGSSDSRDNHPRTDNTLASNLGCDAKFSNWSWTGENDCGNQFFLLHEGSQIFRLVKGHQHFHLLEGQQKYHLVNGHQTFHLEDGDQRFQLDSGDMERYANGHRYSKYASSCVEDTQEFWRFKAGSWFKIQAPIINLDGDVLITGNLHVKGTTLMQDDLQVSTAASVGSGIDTPGITGAANSAPIGNGFGSVSAVANTVDSKNATNPLEAKSCPS